MNIFNSILALALLSSSAALGGTPSALDLNMAKETDYGVQLAVSAKENVTGMNKVLTLAGEGLRSKKVGPLPIKVYIAQFFAELPDAFDRTEQGAMKSMSNIGVAALRLTFLRTVDAATVQSSFKEGLNANDIDPTQEDVATFLNTVTNGGDAISGTSMTIVGSKKADGTEVITYEDSSGTVTSIPGKAGFVNKIFAIWFSESADSGLEKLKNSFFTKPTVTSAN